MRDVLTVVPLRLKDAVGLLALVGFYFDGFAAVLRLMMLVQAI